MISLQQLLEIIRKTTNDPKTIEEAKQLYWMVSQADPKDRFGIIYSMTGPDMDSLAEICEMFDVEFQGFSMYYKVDGVEYSQDIDILDEEAFAEIEAMAEEYYAELEEEEEFFRNLDHDDYPEESPAETINRLYRTFFPED